MMEAKTGASIPQLAEEYGTSEALLYDLANRGKLPGCRRLGKKRFVVHRETFEEWLKGGMGDEQNDGPEPPSPGGALV